MSKNTGATKFRKVNVDEYDEDKYEDEPIDDGDEHGPGESEVNSCLAQNRSADALRQILTSAPTGSKNQTVKDRTAQLMLRVLTSFKSGEIEPVIKSLDQKSIDILMKYIYRGFEYPSEGSSAILLTWHEKVSSSGGLGSIVRVLSDRKRV